MSKHHETLGVKSTATADEIKRAYRKLVKTHHPDVGGDEEKFKAINAAYAALTDPQAAQRENPFSRGGGSNPFEQRPSDGFGGWRQYSYNGGTTGNPADDEFIKEFLKQQFGAGFHPGYQQPPRNRTLSATIRVPLASIVAEQTRVLNVNTGRSQRAVEVKIPAGVHNGAQIRYPGFGADNLTQAPPGDLIVTIIVEDDPAWLRNDDDVLAAIKLDVMDAMLGCEVNVTGIRGNNISVTVPAGIQHGQMLRVAGQGLPGADGKVGNMLLQVHLVVPRQLTETQIATLKAMRDERIAGTEAV